MQVFAYMDCGYCLAQFGDNAVATRITVGAGKEKVLVQVSADLQRLSPSVVSEVVVSETGLAEIRAFTH